MDGETRPAQVTRPPSRGAPNTNSGGECGIQLGKHRGRLVAGRPVAGRPAGWWQGGRPAGEEDNLTDRAETSQEAFFTSLFFSLPERMLCRK